MAVNAQADALRVYVVTRSREVSPSDKPEERSTGHCHPFTNQRCRKAAAAMTEIKQGRLFG
jgi:hypothetical protein